MLKIIQITSIAITIAAIGIIIFAVTSSSSNAKTDELLSSPGVAEQLQASYAGKRTSESDTDTPLMRQAKAFALRINPPPPPTPPPAQNQPGEIITHRPKVAVSAQFTLVGTSYNVGDEANSWALINEVGKGFHWVRLGGVVGHLKIEKIGNGVVLIRDGERTYEMTAEKAQKADLVKSYTGTIPSIVATDIWKGVENPVIAPETAQISESNIPEQPTPELQIVEEPQAAEPNAAEIQANIEWLKQIKENPEAMGMTAEEAKELEGLGDMLKEMETEKERVNSEPNNAEKSEPNQNTGSATNVNSSAEQKSTDVREPESERSKRLKAARRRR